MWELFTLSFSMLLPRPLLYRWSNLLAWPLPDMSLWQRQCDMHTSVVSQCGMLRSLQTSRQLLSHLSRRWEDNSQLLGLSLTDWMFYNGCRVWVLRQTIRWGSCVLSQLQSVYELHLSGQEGALRAGALSTDPQPTLQPTGRPSRRLLSLFLPK